MPKKRLYILFAILFVVPGVIRAQTSLDSLLMDEDIDFSILAEDSLLLDELEGLSIFSLLDSVLNGDYKKSTLALRLGFTSDVVNAGRDFGVSQQGLIPGISFFHKSGLFASVSGYWSSQFDPKYNLTVAGIGYFGEVNKKLSYSLNYEHSFYTDNTTITSTSVDDVTDIIDLDNEVEYTNPLTENMSAGLLLDLNKLYVSTDYSFFFGKETAHRWDWRVTGVFRKKSFMGLDRITINPSFSVLLGTQGVVNARYSEGTLDNVTQRERAETTWSIIQELDEQALFRRLEPVQRRAYLRQLQPLVDEALLSLTDTKQQFGLMNYGFSLPISLRKKKWNFTMSYNYNIPVELPGEDLDLSSSGYLGLSLSYYISL